MQSHVQRMELSTHGKLSQVPPHLCQSPRRDTLATSERTYNTFPQELFRLISRVFLGGGEGILLAAWKKASQIKISIGNWTQKIGKPT